MNPAPVRARKLEPRPIERLEGLPSPGDPAPPGWIGPVDRRTWKPSRRGARLVARTIRKRDARGDFSALEFFEAPPDNVKIERGVPVVEMTEAEFLDLFGFEFENLGPIGRAMLEKKKART